MNQKRLRAAREEYREMKKQAHNNNNHGGDGGEEEDDGGSSEEDEVFFTGLANGIAAQDAVPSQEVVAQVLLKKKRDELLNRFA
mmetsp:Transcript_25737/g.54384  ORF Transcript_25737/g.54384 Transcript_25737/m.54384 type:complete len:84 (+) Transcript_25737:2-253(+)